MTEKISGLQIAAVARKISVVRSAFTNTGSLKTQAPVIERVTPRRNSRCAA